MSTPFGQLLDASIEYLRGLKAQGVQWVPVSRATLAALAQTPAPPPPVPAGVQPRFKPQVSTPAQFEPPAPAGREVRQPPAITSPAPAALLFAEPESQPAPAAPALSPEAKAQAMAALRERAQVCVQCPHLVAARANVVFGVGDSNAELMFVGEAPGADEDRQGEPFVGAAGQLLTRIIQSMGLTRQRVYIANILKCRPDLPPGSFSNRKPTTEEMRTCLPFLHEQIDIIRPRVLVALGATAVEGLLGKTIGITRLRGHWQTYRDIPLMPTFHPAFLLRTTQTLADKRKVWEDMLQVMERLGLPISERQRRFFSAVQG
jgi:DNA polymerase